MKTVHCCEKFKYLQLYEVYYTIGDKRDTGFRALQPLISRYVNKFKINDFFRHQCIVHIYYLRFQLMALGRQSL